MSVPDSWVSRNAVSCPLCLLLSLLGAGGTAVAKGSIFAIAFKWSTWNVWMKKCKGRATLRGEPFLPLLLSVKPRS